MKSLGTGVRGVGWRDIEVVRAPSGAPSILLHGRALARAQRLGVHQISLSITHGREYAVAFVAVLRQPPPDGHSQPGLAHEGQAVAPLAGVGPQV